MADRQFENSLSIEWNEVNGMFSELLTDEQKDKIARYFKLFSERELRLINNCHEYAEDDPAGLPGHNLMIIIHKLAADWSIIEPAINMHKSASRDSEVD